MTDTSDILAELKEIGERIQDMRVRLEVVSAVLDALEISHGVSDKSYIETWNVCERPAEPFALPHNNNVAPHERNGQVGAGQKNNTCVPIAPTRP